MARKKIKPDNGWDEWKNHVLAELKRQGDGIESLRVDVAALTAAVAGLKVRSSFWGAISGALAGIGAALLESFRRH